MSEQTDLKLGRLHYFMVGIIGKITIRHSLSRASHLTHQRHHAAGVLLPFLPDHVTYSDYVCELRNGNTMIIMPI